MSKTKFAIIHCAEEKCEKEIGRIPLAILPLKEDVEIYCENCALKKDADSED